MDKRLKELKTEFAEFVDQIPEYLKRLNDLLQVNLGFEYEDIDKVQQFYSINFSNPEKYGINIETLNKYFYAFMGEAFMHYNAGRWDLCVSKKDKAYGTPIILDWHFQGNKGVSISPYIWKEYIVRGLMDEPISKIIWRSQVPMKL